LFSLTSPTIVANIAAMQRLLTQREAALALSLSTRSMERMRCAGGGPKFVRLSRGRIAYRETDLEEWTAKRVVSSTSEDAV
jgi:predicted DNA-binding transcriptional regulator AlpA